MFYTYVTFTNTCTITCERHQYAAVRKGWTFLESMFEEQWTCYFCHQSEERPVASVRSYTVGKGAKVRTIWKFECELDTFERMMPKGANILTFATQRETPCFWAIVDDEQPLEERRFLILGTGHRFRGLEDETTYIGTCQQGALVWHLFEFLGWKPVKEEA